jgi:hypothetical protein
VSHRLAVLLVDRAYVVHLLRLDVVSAPWARVTYFVPMSTS